MNQAELIGGLALAIIPAVSVFLVFRGQMKTAEQNMKERVTENEHRMTVLEMEQTYQRETLTTHTKRLDDHDAQNKALIALSEKVDYLIEDVKEIKRYYKEEKGK